MQSKHESLVLTSSDYWIFQKWKKKTRHWQVCCQWNRCSFICSCSSLSPLLSSLLSLVPSPPFHWFTFLSRVHSHPEPAKHLCTKYLPYEGCTQCTLCSVKLNILWNLNDREQTTKKRKRKTVWRTVSQERSRLMYVPQIGNNVCPDVFAQLLFSVPATK